MSNVQPLQSRTQSSVVTSSGGPHDPMMSERLAKIEALIPSLATKSDVAEIRTDLHKMDASIVRWMIATVISLFLGFAGLFFTMSSSINGSLERAARATPAPQAVTQPLVIAIPSSPAANQEPAAQTGPTEREPKN